MANYGTVTHDCYVSSGQSSAGFFTGDTISPYSAFYPALQSAGLLSDSGNPAPNPGGLPTPVATISVVGIPSAGSVPTWDGAKYIPQFSAVGAIPALGSKVVAFGDSFLQAGGATHVDRQFITLFGGLSRSGLRDLGVGASECANDMTWRGSAVGWGGWAWVLQNVSPYRAGAPYSPSSNFVPFIHTGTNDVIQHSHDSTGNPRLIFKSGLRTQMSRCCASKVFESSDPALVFSGGTWQTKADTNKNSGVQYKPIPGNGAVMTFTIPADFEGGTIAVGFTCWPAGDGIITWTGTASVLPVGTTSLAGLAYAANGATGDGKRDSSNGHVTRIKGLVAGDAGKTIIATYSGGAGTQFATPNAPSGMTTVGAAGAVTYSYTRVYRTYNGDTVPSTAGSIATGNATLSGTNYISIPAGPAWPAGVEQELIVRTVGGTPGIVAILSAPAIVLDQIPTAGGWGNTYTPVAANPLVGGGAVNYVQIESNTPVTRGMVCNINQFPSAQMTALAPVTLTDIANYNADIATVVAEFDPGQWLIVDCDGALGAAASLFNTSPNIHPNDRGYAAMAAKLQSQFSAWAATIPTSDQAHQSRLLKSPTGRTIARSPLAVATNQNGVLWGTGGFWVMPAAMGDLDATYGFQSIDAQVGDDLEVSLNGMWFPAAQAGGIEIVTTNGTAGNVINCFSSGTPVGCNIGVPGFYNNGAAAVLLPINGKITYTVQQSDLQSLFTVLGIVIVKLRGFGGAGRQIYCGGSGIPFQWEVVNKGQRNTPGFNAS